VLGALCGQVGAVMATEAVKLITGTGAVLLGRVLVLDGLAARWSEIPLVGGAARLRPAQESSDYLDHCEIGADVAAKPAEAVATVTALELKDRLADREAGGSEWLLVDVREPGERAIVTIPGSVGVPLAAVLDGSGRPAIPPGQPIVLYCRSGVRSERAALCLLADGYPEVAHLVGGVLAWIDAVDPELPSY